VDKLSLSTIYLLETLPKDKDSGEKHSNIFGPSTGTTICVRLEQQPTHDISLFLVNPTYVYIRGFPVNNVFELCSGILSFAYFSRSTFESFAIRNEDIGLFVVSFRAWGFSSIFSS